MPGGGWPFQLKPQYRKLHVCCMVWWSGGRVESVEHRGAQYNTNEVCGSCLNGSSAAEPGNRWKPPRACECQTVRSPCRKLCLVELGHATRAIKTTRSAICTFGAVFESIAHVKGLLPTSGNIWLYSLPV